MLERNDIKCGSSLINYKNFEAYLPKKEVTHTHCPSAKLFKIHPAKFVKSFAIPARPGARPQPGILLWRRLPEVRQRQRLLLQRQLEQRPRIPLQLQRVLRLREPLRLGRLAHAVHGRHAGEFLKSSFK